MACPIPQGGHKKLKPGLVASYDIWPGNGEGLFLFRNFINLSLTYLHTYPLTYSPGTHTGNRNQLKLQLHRVSKNVPPLTCCNLDIHGSIKTIFGTCVTEKVGNKMYFIFPPHLTCAFALPGETGNPKIASFHLNAACFLPKTT